MSLLLKIVAALRALGRLCATAMSSGTRRTSHASRFEPGRRSLGWSQLAAPATAGPPRGSHWGIRPTRACSTKAMGEWQLPRRPAGRVRSTRLLAQICRCNERWLLVGGRNPPASRRAADRAVARGKKPTASPPEPTHVTIDVEPYRMLTIPVNQISALTARAAFDARSAREDAAGTGRHRNRTCFFCSPGDHRSAF